MNWSILISGLFLAVGWIVSHWLSDLRNKAQEKRRVCLQKLIEAYETIEECSNRNDFDKRAFERALATVQLLGSNTEQVKLASDVVSGLGKNNLASCSKLLSKLRSDVRAELSLPSVTKQIRHLRFEKD